MRMTLVFSGMFVFAILVLYTVFKIQVFEGKKWRAMADSLSTHVFEIEATRGNIFDCQGNLLATSMPIYDVFLDTKAKAFQDEEGFQNSLDSLTNDLSVLFGDKSALAYKQSLLRAKREGNRYFLFKRKISFMQLHAMLEMPIFRLGKKNKYAAGLRISERTRREKPFGMLAERTIGFKQEIGSVRVGLEGFFDEKLSGKSGKHVMQRIAGGTWVPIDDELLIDAQQGKDIVSTLDINLQDVAENALLSNLILNDAEFGTAILMEVVTGDIKAVANLTRESEGVYKEKYNYAVGESVEPGSTFKLVSALSLLEDGFMKPEDKVDAENGQKAFCKNAVMKDAEFGTGVITLQQAFEHSSNVAFGKLMKKYYESNPSKVFKHYEALGLTKKLDLQLSGVGMPNVKGPNHKAWSCTSLPYMAIGYELTVTPLQLLSIYNAVANNGVMMKPNLVKNISQAGKVLKTYPPVVLNPQICKPEVAKQLRTMMEGVVLHGTASTLKSNFYSYAGKTGTAVITGPRQASRGKSYRASFCGYFPAENPKYSCFVLVSRPSEGEYYAAKVALPIFKEIADKVYASALNLHRELKFTNPIFSTDLPQMPMADKGDVKEILNQVKLSSHFHNDSIHQDETDWVLTSMQDKSMAMQPVIVQSTKMPDLRGMGARDAMYLLERKGIHVQLIGLGKVKKQSLSPGSPLRKNLIIQLQLG